jgi:hypothetical protein
VNVPVTLEVMLPTDAAGAAATERELVPVLAALAAVVDRPSAPAVASEAAVTARTRMWGIFIIILSLKDGQDAL